MTSHAFCYSNGAAVDREGVTLAAYLEAAQTETVDQPADQGAAVPSQQNSSSVELLYVKRQEDSPQGDAFQPPDALPLDLGEVSSS